VQVKAVIWMGSSREKLRKFPKTLQGAIGFELFRVQSGLEPTDWKPMTSVGTGVREIRVRDETGIFRLIYLAARPEGIYVLHCFQKKTRQTSRLDLELAAKRFKSISKVKS
jgi:phage-related protein